MRFLVQHNLINFNQLIDIKRALAPYPTVYCGLIPFSRELTGMDIRDHGDREFIPYGSTLLTTVGLDYGWSGLHFDLANFNYGQAIRHRDDMLNSGECRLDIAIDYLKSVPRDQLVFVRPSHDLKQFSGQVIEAGECVDWFMDMMECETSGSYKLDPSTLVVVSEPKNIDCEWRYFIVDGKIVSGSIYRIRNQLRSIRETDPDVLAEAQEFANQWLPDRCCVMDLALTSSCELKVIEFNCINASGFYDADIDAVFKALWEYHQ